MTPEQLERYKRHLLVKEVGGSGQKKLLAAKVLIVGAGALGGVAAKILAASGIGHLVVFDDDRVDLSNLQRQTQFETSDVGASKVGALFRHVTALNPHTHLEPQQERWTEAAGLCGADLVLDGSDNFETRFALNREARMAGIPLVSGAVAGWTGQIMAVNEPGNPTSPCYQCFVPEKPPQAGDCNDLGVIGAVTHMVASHMALAATRIILGETTRLYGALSLIEGLSGEMRTIRLPQDAACPVCSTQQASA